MCVTKEEDFILLSTMDVDYLFLGREGIVKNPKGFGAKGNYHLIFFMSEGTAHCSLPNSEIGKG